jgi:hypothetical protein
MHIESTTGRFDGQPHTDLVLERLPNGELGWLRVVRDSVDAPPQRYWLTDLGRRRAVAEDRVSSMPWKRSSRSAYCSPLGGHIAADRVTATPPTPLYVRPDRA